MKFNLILTTTLVIISITLIDTSIIRTIGYTDSRITDIKDIIIYTVFVCGSLFCSIILLSSTSKLFNFKNKKANLILINRIVAIVQFTISGILIALIVQMAIFSHYNRDLLIIAVYLIFVLSIGISVLLVLKFIQWFKRNYNYTLLLYILAFMLLITKSIIAAVYVSQELYNHSILVHPGETHRMTLSLSNLKASLSNLLKDSYYYTSILAYILIWVTTAILLKHYSKRLGKIRYWILISIPIVFYLIQDKLFQSGIFNYIFLISPNLFGLFYSLSFTAIQLVAGLFACLVFVLAARDIKKEKISNSLIVSAVGILILINSFEISGAYIGAYPPYGLTTVSLIGLASYLVFVGTFSFAIYVGNDMQVRKEIYKMVESNPQLLRNIGVSEGQIEIERRVKKMQKLKDQDDQSLREDYESGEIKELIQDILRQLKKEKEKNS
jgi:hypothetical protein